MNRSTLGKAKETRMQTLQNGRGTGGRDATGRVILLGGWGASAGKSMHLALGPSCCTRVQSFARELFSAFDNRSRDGLGSLLKRLRNCHMDLPCCKTIGTPSTVSLISLHNQN